MQAVVSARPAATATLAGRAAGAVARPAPLARGRAQQPQNESLWQVGPRACALSAALLVSARAASRASKASRQGARQRTQKLARNAVEEEIVFAEPQKRPKVRFAPSPTGVLHVGGARTALFNWLYAKSVGGDMVLRIEDTDMARSTSESEAAILEGLKWCGITWDEGPDCGGPAGLYRCSERIDAGIYEDKLQQLIEKGNAYKCFLTSEELDDMRAEAERNEQAFVVQSIWASATPEQIQAKLDEGAPYVYRFRVPQDEEIVINDLVLGEVEWSSDDLGGDFVIQRSSGVPMYNFGVVVDDGMMGITHVFRAQEHLMNTPRQVLIYRALGMTPPEFGHMPLILAPDRSKLSKRHGAVSVGDYQKQGYLASGMINYLSQLGWNDGTNKEIYNLDELTASFTMNRMSKTAAIFDKDKFKWVNGHHVRLLDDEQAQDQIGAILVEQGLVKDKAGEFSKQASVLLRDRISTLAEAGDELKSMMGFDLQAMLANDDFRRWIDDGSVQETAKLIAEAYDAGDLDAIGEDPDVFKKLAKKISEARGGVKKKALLAPLRLCLTGVDSGPDMAKFFGMLKLADDSVLIEHPMLSERVQQLKAMKVQIKV